MGFGSSFRDYNRYPPNNYYNYYYYYTRFQRVLKTWIACLASFCASIAGGLLLTWWELRHHPTNSQLWMVPFGLVLFITPLIIWLSLCVTYMFDNPDSHPVIAEANSIGLPNVQSGDAP